MLKLANCTIMRSLSDVLEVGASYPSILQRRANLQGRVDRVRTIIQRAMDRAMQDLDEGLRAERRLAGIIEGRINNVLAAHTHTQP